VKTGSRTDAPKWKRAKRKELVVDIYAQLSAVMEGK
jgi:hypothetical protein